MDNRINLIRKKIRALRISMLEAEAVMHEKINRDEEYATVAGEIIFMRAVMTSLVADRSRLGDASLSWSTASSSPTGLWRNHGRSRDSSLLGHENGHSPRN